MRAPGLQRLLTNQSAPAMKITEVETLLMDQFPNLTFVRLHTDEGIVGLGETFFTADAVASWIHSMAAPYLLGKDPLRIEQHWQSLNGFVGFNSTGVEMRARSALDVALWDILGQVCRQPIYQLLGGAVRDRVPVYNTCAGYGYVRKSLERVGIVISLPNCPKAHAASSNRSPVPDSAPNCCQT